MIASWGNAEKVEIVGIPRLEAMRQMKKSSPDNRCFRLLIMTAKCPAFTEQHREKVIQSLLDLKQWIAQSPTLAGKRIEVCWRLTEDLDQVVDVPNELNDLSGAELSGVLSRVDAVISTPSTAALESQISGHSDGDPGLHQFSPSTSHPPGQFRPPNTSNRP